MLNVYNDLTRRIEHFETFSPHEIKFYVCGVTPYDLSHLGHARCYVAWDVVRRYLTYLGYHVHYVQNFTDIDDKIIRRGRELGEDPLVLAQRNEAEYFRDMDRLGVLRATSYPRATEHISEILKLTQGLLAKGYAYAVSDGTVYFRVSSFLGYGKLSGRSVASLTAQTRLDEPDPLKADPADFALWKAAKADEPSWDSPWGRGRPGWHIECSAMVLNHLGISIDIHCGGSDLTFPHHENEIAQSEAYTSKPMSRFWLHNGMVRVGSDKMAKSLGNFTTVRDLLVHFEPQDVRYFLLQTHYRQDIGFSEEALRGAGTAIGRLRRSLAEREEALAEETPRVTAAREAFENRFRAGMDDDFNTPKALASIWDARSAIAGFEGADRAAAGHVVAAIRAIASAVLGLDLQLQKTTVHADKMAALVPALQQMARDYADRMGSVPPNGTASELLGFLVERRSRAKQARDFAVSDAIRIGLGALGVSLADKPGGAVAWEWVSNGAIT